MKFVGYDYNASKITVATSFDPVSSEPELLLLNVQEVLASIPTFHQKRVCGKFPENSLELPWIVPTFNIESIKALYPLYISLLANLDTLVGLITDYQPHGTLAALYLLEFPFYAIENVGSSEEQYVDGFPLSDVLAKMAKNRI